VKKKFTAPMLAPKYVTQFRCLGGDCPDTCCAGWQVTVDKDTFRDYRRVAHPVLKPLFQLHLVQNDKNSYSAHGKLKLRDSDLDCGLHATDGSCQVQNILGEDALSDTCYIYPRSVHKVGERFEQCLTLSCPEAARLALTQDDAYEFTSTEFTSRQSTTAELPSVHGFDVLAMDEIRLLCVQLFQTAGLSNTERLVFLGWLCSQLDELIASKSQAHALEVLKQLTELVESGGLQSAAAKLSSHPALAASVFSILFGSPAGKGSSANQREVVAWVSQGLNFDSSGATDPAQLEGNYRRGLAHLGTNAALLDQVLTRYLLNDMLREVFPWGRLSPMAHYRRLLTRFGILRLMLAAVAAARDCPLDLKTMVQVTQVFCRLYQHNEAFATRADQILTGSDWDQLDRLYALL
jgi:lysine-N-methylase